MPTMSGADPDLLDVLAREMTSAAQRLRALEARVSAQVRNAPWAGRDADALRADWQGRHGRAVVVAADDLDRAAEVVTRNAAEQRQASAADGGVIGPVPGTPTRPDGRPVGAPTGDPAHGDPPGTPVRPGSPFAPPVIGRPADWTLFDPRTVSVDGKGQVAGVDLEGRIAASKMTGDLATDATLAGPTVTFTPDGEPEHTLAQASVKGKAKYVVAGVEAEGKASTGPLELGGKGEAFLGAQATGEAGVYVKPDAVEAKVAVEAKAGASAEGQIKAAVAGVGAVAAGHVTAGVEFKAEAAAEVSRERIGVSLELAAALGIGGGGKLGFEVEPDEVAEEVADMLDDLW